MNIAKKSIFGDAVILILGSAMFGLSVNMFVTPGGITMGGFTGISTTLRYFFHTPVGLMILLLNAPLLVLETRLGHGGEGAVRAALGIAGTSLMTDAMAAFPYEYGDTLLCAVFGGLLMGAGSGLLLTRGFTTGGSDLCAYLLKPRLRRFSTGRLIMLIDAVIIIGSSLATGHTSGVFFSFVAVWCYTTAFDRVADGFGGGKLALIISDRHEKIAEKLSAGLMRGVTVIPGRGWYTGQEKNVLMCVVKRSQLYSLTALISEADSKAFVIISDAAAVMGEGFKKESGADEGNFS